MTDQIGVARQLTKQVKFVHKVAIVDVRQALIIKRSAQEKTRPNCWDFPGGNMEWPTVDHSATNLHLAEVAREVREEVGLKLNPAQLTADNLVYFETYFDQPAQIFKIYCGWRAKLLSETQANAVQLSSEHQDFAWISLNQATDYDFGGAGGAFILRHLTGALQ